MSSKRFSAGRGLFFCACGAALLSACQTTGGGTPDPFVNTPDNTAADLNTTFGPLSFGDRLQFTAENEEFPALVAGLTVVENGPDDPTNGFELVEVVTTDINQFSSIAPVNQFDSVAYDADDLSLTFDVNQGTAQLQDTIAPIVFAPPGDDPLLTFDVEATYLAAFGDRFPSPGDLGIDGVDFDPTAFERDIQAADNALFDLSQNNDPDAQRYFELLTESLIAFDDDDFITYFGENGATYAQLIIRGNNANVETDYVVLGEWENAPVAVGENRTFGTLVFGNLSLPEEIPDVGTASYDGTIGGRVLRENEIETLRGSFDLDVNFQSRAVTADVASTIAVFGPGGETVFTDFIDLNGTGRIGGNGNVFSGSLVGTIDPTVTGEFNGAFFGPAAAEVGGTFSFTNGAVAASGGFIGTQN